MQKATISRQNVGVEYWIYTVTHVDKTKYHMMYGEKDGFSNLIMVQGGCT